MPEPTKPMDPERLASVRQWVRDSSLEEPLPLDLTDELLADRDHWEAEARRHVSLARVEIDKVIRSTNADIERLQLRVAQLEVENTQARTAAGECARDALRYRARCPVEASDVEAAGVTAVEARAWLEAPGIDEDLAVDWYDDFSTNDIADLCNEAAEEWEWENGKLAMAILDEMAALAEVAKP